MLIESVIYLEKQKFSFIINVNGLPFISEVIIFLGPRKTLHFIIKLKLVETWTVFRNAIMCCREQ